MTDKISYARVKSDVESARTYNQRKQSKHTQEMAMIEEAMRQKLNSLEVLLRDELQNKRRIQQASGDTNRYEGTMVMGACALISMYYMYDFMI